VWCLAQQAPEVVVAQQRLAVGKFVAWVGRTAFVAGLAQPGDIRPAVYLIVVVAAAAAVVAVVVVVAAAAAVAVAVAVESFSFVPSGVVGVVAAD